MNVMLLIVQIATLIMITIYTGITFGMMMNSRKTLEFMQEVQARTTDPYVVAYLDNPYGTHEIYLVINNIGKTNARDVKFKFKPDLRTSGKEQILKNWGILKDGIASIIPNQELRSYFDLAPKYLSEDNKLPMLYEVHIDYSNDKGHKFTYETKLDIKGQFGKVFTKKYNISDLTEIFKESVDGTKPLKIEIINKNNR